MALPATPQSFRARGEAQGDRRLGRAQQNRPLPAVTGAPPRKAATAALLLLFPGEAKQARRAASEPQVAVPSPNALREAAGSAPSVAGPAG